LKPRWQCSAKTKWPGRDGADSGAEPTGSFSVTGSKGIFAGRWETRDKSPRLLQRFWACLLPSRDRMPQWPGGSLPGGKIERRCSFDRFTMAGGPGRRFEFEADFPWSLSILPTRLNIGTIKYEKGGAIADQPLHVICSWPQGAPGRSARQSQFAHGKQKDDKGYAPMSSLLWSVARPSHPDSSQL